MGNGIYYKTESIYVKLTQEEKTQLRKVAMHYKMNESQLVRNLIKREAIRIS
jgi:hypothetical protein